tara:strand:+ start:1440 stop:1676 length:237 start_codon:yes stop_codon:yes gene_type:complete
MSITKNRACWLSTIKSSRGDWNRDDCVTKNIRSGRKMPEPVYMWLIENHFVDVDLGSLVITQKGVDALIEYRKREVAS